MSRRVQRFYNGTLAPRCGWRPHNRPHHGGGVEAAGATARRGGARRRRYQSAREVTVRARCPPEMLLCDRTGGQEGLDERTGINSTAYPPVTPVREVGLSATYSIPVGRWQESSPAPPRPHRPSVLGCSVAPVASTLFRARGERLTPTHERSAEAGRSVRSP
jgi:hypothetical protein